MTDELKTNFTNVITIERPQVITKKISNPNWLAGFTTGEGCFFINIQKSKSHKLGIVVQLKLHLAQHERDEVLMKNLIEYLDCGKVYKYKNIVEFQVTKFSDLTDKVLPFFIKYPIQGIKFKDFEDFCQAVEIIKNKGHLTVKGLNEIYKIKENMNTGRELH